MKILVFGSGRGSNYKAIVENTDSSLVEVSAVVVNRPEAPIIELARGFNHRVILVESRGMNREMHEEEILRRIEKYQFDLVVLAGYMRILSKNFLSSLKVPIINIHPSLLPSFPGLNAQKQAIDAGVKESGCTVHLVNELVDSGRILGQERVPVYPDDSDKELANRILEKEHTLYPHIISEIARGNIRI